MSCHLYTYLIDCYARNRFMKKSSMSAQISRLQFLRGDFKGTVTPLRPPWALSENQFISTCTACGECVSHCPTSIIKQGRANLPVIDFKTGECVFCEACVDVCKPKALVKTEQHKPWSITATINEDICLAHKGVECRSCYDPCESRAISMPPKLGGISIPILNADKCTGCGACFSVCPAQSVTMAVTQ